MKTLITGAGGFLGGHLTTALMGQHPAPQVVSLGLKAPADPRVRHFDCDLLDEKTVASIVASEKPDRVFHLAGSARVAAEIGFPEYFRSNLVTTENLLRALEGLNRPLRIFFSSSVHVYGDRAGIVDETAVPMPNSSYGMSKYLAERALARFAATQAHASAAVGRLYSCIGPSQAEGFVLSDLTRKLVRLSPESSTLETGPVDALRRFLDVRDAASILPRLLDAVSPGRFEIVNIASPFEMRIREIVEQLVQVSGRKVRIDARPSASNPFLGLQVSLEKLHGMVPGFEHRPLRQTLDDIWRWGLAEFGQH